MSTMKKRIPMFLLALAMMVAMALPTFALSNKTSTMPSNHDAEECVSDIVAANSDDTGTVTPYAAAHCEKTVMLATTFVLIPLLFQSERSFGIVQTVVLESAITACSITDLKHIVVICAKVNIPLLTIIGEIGYAHKGIILFHLCL